MNEVTSDKIATGGQPRERRVVRPSGFAGSMQKDAFLKKNSKYGVVYFCTACGKQARGTDFQNGSHHHWTWCLRFEDSNA